MLPANRGRPELWLTAAEAPLRQPRDARDGRKAVGVLALHREHEGIDGDRRWVWLPGHEPVEQSIVPSHKEVYRVWAIPLVDLVKDCGLEPDVGVVLLPAG